MSFLSSFGKDFKAVFSWLGSTKGQAVIATGETLVEAAAPSSAGIFTLANNWLTEIVKTESLAAAAGEQTGSGTQKAAAVTTAVTPEVLAFAQANGLPAPTADKIAVANTALVAFLNAFEGPTTAAASATPAPTVAVPA